VEIQADQEKVKADGKKANSDYNAADQRVKTLEASINGHRSAIQDLQRAKTSRLSVFHNSMPNVVAEIQRQKSRFRDPPIGPLGAYIKIRDEKWANIVEVLVGRNLNGFLVTNEQDRATLRAILEQKRWYSVCLKCTANHKRCPHYHFATRNV
jgi:structural maintenance of chromosomes protein 6